MAQNYHKKSSSANKRRGEKRSSGFSVFVSGFILGVIACQILPYLLKSENPNSTANDSAKAEAPAAPDFQFPNLLKVELYRRTFYLLKNLQQKRLRMVESM